MSKKNTTNFKSKKNVSPIFKLKECVIRLTRINLAEVASTNIHFNNKPLSSSLAYNLRNKSLPKNDRSVKCVLKRSKPLNQIVATSQAALYSARAMRIWDTVKKQCIQNNISIKLNDVVCARMAGHQPWPSVVEKFKKNGVELKFFGTYEIGTVKKSEIAPLDLCKELVEEYLKISTSGLNSRTLLYHASFIKATREVGCIDYAQAFSK